MIFKKIEWRGFFSILLFAFMWEAAVRLHFLSEFLVSMPSQVFKNGLALLTDSNFYRHAFISLETFFLGYLLAVIFGVLSGILIGSSKKALSYFNPFILMLSALPIVAVVPLIVIWLGFGIASKVAIVFLISVVPIIISSIDGAKNTRRAYLLLAKSFQFSRIQILRNVVFLDALPHIFSGLRIAIGRGVLGLVIAEVFGYGKGLGYLISYYSSTTQVANLIFIILFLIIVTMILTGIISFLQKNMITWKK